MSNPEDLVDRALEAHRNDKYGGRPCRTCQLSNADEINRAARHFLKKRISGETTMPWAAFVRVLLVPEYDYPYQAQALKNHLEKCLELDA